jgi:hypothetical protein
MTNEMSGQNDTQLEGPAPLASTAAPEQAQQPPLIEEIASLHGWKPDGKLDAETYLRGVPNYKTTLVAKLTTAEQAIEEREQRLRQLEEEHRALYDHIVQESLKRAEQEKALAAERLRRAVESGDPVAAQRAAEDMAKPPPTLTPPQERAADGWAAWRASNADIVSDPEMWADAKVFADAEARRLGRDDPAVIGPIVVAKVRKLHSQKFVNPNRAAPTVEAGTQRPLASRREPSLEDLPADLREHYGRLMATNPKLTPAKILASLQKLPPHMR